MNRGFMSMDPEQYGYPSRRNLVFASRGMCCSCVPQASQAGLDMLKKGGSAVDAALAMALCLPLVEPTCNGLGSDCFALIWIEKDKKLYGINGSGRAPKRLSAQAVRSLGHESMPSLGWLPTMVPGAPAAWAAIRRRFASLSWEELMAPALSYAREGYPVSVNVAKLWRSERERIMAAAKDSPELFAPWVENFTIGGRAPRAGELFRLPDYADTLEELARSDFRSYYEGSVMEKILAFSEKTGGWFSKEDFTGYSPEWVEPISTSYRGYDVCELPPNGHGVSVLMALNILKGMELGERDSAQTWHRMIEAMKLAFADARRFVADPAYMELSTEQLLSPAYAAKRRAEIGGQALYPQAGDPSCGDTVYFCTADGEGNMVSFIQSNYTEFGSGIVIPGTGISLQNRGANFSLDPESPNCLEGGKRSYHTIIPGFLMKDGEAVGPFGVMGGFMQPQGHLQVLVNTLDYHMNPQQALDAPRFQWVGEKKIQIEASAPEGMARELEAMGHQVEIMEDSISMGRGQIIWRDPSGVLIGGTEPRSDGAIAPW